MLLPGSIVPRGFVHDDELPLREASGRVYHRAAMTSKRTAIVLGGSGSVGTALLRELFHDDGFDAVITLSRRSLPEAVAMARSAGRRLVEKLVPDMKPAPLAAATLANVGGHLAGWIANPQALKPGNRMPQVPLEPAEFHAVLRYVQGLR